MSTPVENQPPIDSPPRVVVVGVGNLLLRDEGIGIHAVRALQELDLPPDVKIIDGGTSPDLIAYTRVGDKLIIVDAARAGGEPGAIYRFRPGDLAGEKGSLASAHELGVEHNLKLMSLTGNEPRETVIIGIEPKEIDWGTELSPELRRKVPEIVKVVLREIGTP
ncbi:MAG TPA: HyaD/HybD family hydrogenase maturation endopeptidase [Dehalococcoidales bacterium]|nr:HyaD/HybD family hydrogenase maturation endopeptidase [Dehalococcoidales bacterium]